MGLCKCPKRRVTNQFCFEHRVNVCEHCMVTKHPKCIVQSYLHWLQDSDCNPICEFCTKSLSSEDCVRLTCYHVYHWWCLDSWARNFPPDTAPAGFTCPACRAPLFPPPNLISPVADVLKEKLAGVNWARTGLDLPLLSEDVSDQRISERPVYTTSFMEPNSSPTSSSSTVTSHSIVHMPEVNNTATFSRSDASHSSAPRRTTVQDNEETSRNVINDHDENKYKRRSPREWLLRKWKNIWFPGRSRRHWRPLVAIIFVVVIVLFLLGIFGRLSIDEHDPAFDVYQHPQIKQQDS